MKINADQLTSHLQRQLLPVYLVSGDDVLRTHEACQSIIEKAQAMGFDEKQVFEAGVGFDWQQLMFFAGAGSLFAQKRLIDLRIDSGKPGIEGSTALEHYMEKACNDSSLLLIRTPYLNKTATNAKWFKALQSQAGIIQVWPLNPMQIPCWIQQRGIKKGLNLDKNSTQLIAEYTEGNLLAAEQALEKMHLRYINNQDAQKKTKPLSMEEVLETLSDDSVFDGLALVKYVLQGDSSRVYAVWQHLKAVNAPQVLILWHLTDMLRHLVTQAEQGALPKWGIRPDTVAAYQKAAHRHDLPHLYRFIQTSAQIDQAIKGVSGAHSGDSWQALLQLSMACCNKKLAHLYP